MEKAVETVKKAAKFWRRLDTWGSIVLLVLIAALLVSTVGFPKEIEEERSAAVITETGELVSCEVRVTGNMTRYPLRDKVIVDKLSVWLDDRLVVEFENGNDPYSYSSSYRYTGILCRDREAILAELDYAYLFPDEEPMRCVFAVPYRSC